MNIAVIGSGAWGTALALLLLENGHAVTLCAHTAEKARALAETRENPMLPGVPLPPALHCTGDLACVRGCGALVLATPSFAVRETAQRLAPLLNQKNENENAIVISVSKGIEQGSSLTLTQVLAQVLGAAHPVVALSGPSHAEEVGRGVPTAVVSASADRAAAELVQDLFMNERFRVYASPDVIGVELGGALKNVIALCAGCCDGLGFGDNTKAALMTRGLTEMARLGVALGGRKETFAGLTGVGDLMVTCTSMHSRNRRCGMFLGEGMAVEAAVQAVGAVVEGYYAAATAKTLAEKTGVEMPIAAAAYEVLYHGKNPRAVIAELMTREKRHELEKSWVD